MSVLEIPFHYTAVMKELLNYSLKLTFLLFLSKDLSKGEICFYGSYCSY